MRFIGIDYGKKNVGVAISDEMGLMAFPEVVLKNDKSLILSIQKICEEKDVKKIILGESLNFQGKPNKIMEGISSFKEELGKRLSLPVTFESEFLTTREATRIQKESETTDASAAALILQSFLDRNKNN